MKKATLIFIVVFLFGFQHAYAQSAADRAKAYYFEAVNSFEQRNYQKTLDYCKEVEEILGNSNARVEVLRVKSHFELGNIDQAKQALDRFSTYDAEDVLSREIAPYIVKIEDSENERKRKEAEAIQQAEREARQAEIQAQKEAAEKQERKERMDRLIAQLVARIEEDKLDEATSLLSQAKQLNGQGAEYNEQLAYLSSHLDELKEEKSLYRGAAAGRVASMTEYLQKFADYPNAPKVAQMRQEKEGAAYTAAISSDNSVGYKRFLSDFSYSERVGEIKQRLAVAEEREAYEVFSDNRTVANARAYFSDYPNGRYQNQVVTQLEESLFATGEQAFLQGDYAQARMNYLQYKDIFSDGEHIRTVERNLQKSESKIAAQQRIASRRRLSYTMLTYGTNGAIGFDLGAVNVGYTPGLYFAVNANPEAFKMSFSPEDEIPTLDGIDDSWYKTGLVTGSLGLNVTVFYPLSVYAGAGVRYQSYYSTEDNNVTFKVEDRKPWTVFPEAGLKCRVGKSLIFKVGAQFINDGTAIHFGIGF